MELHPIPNHATLPDMPSATNADHDGRYPTRAEWLQNGFPNRTDSSISWSDSTPDRTFTIAPANGSFDYFIDGVKYTKSSSETIQITDTEGLWTFYYDGSTLTSQHNPTDAQIETIILSAAWIAFVYWDAANNVGTLLEERHGFSISPYTHRELHFTAGTTFFDGLALGDFVISDGADNEDAQFSIATGQIFDEDIKHIINAINKTTGVDIWYRSNGDWRKDTQAGFKVLTQDGTSGTRLSYDNAGTRTEVTDNKFVLYHIFAWNAADLNPITIMGQAEYATAKLARAGASTEINSLLLGTLPSKEMKAIATVIFQTKDTYTNDVNARVVQTDEGDNYVDWRAAGISPSAATQEHGLLAGLADDDHTQYLLADGTRVAVKLSVVGDLSVALTGTVEATNGSDAIVGTGTNFDNGEIQAGDAIKIESDVGAGYEIFTVDDITDDTHLTLDSNYQGSNDSGLSAWTDPDPLFEIENGDAESYLICDRNGRIGIGKTPVSFELEVEGQIDATGGIAVDQSVTAGLNVQAGATSKHTWSGNTGTYIGRDVANTMQFATGNVERLEINGSEATFTVPISTNGNISGVDLTASGTITDGTWATTAGVFSGIADLGQVDTADIDAGTVDATIGGQNPWRLMS